MIFEICSYLATFNVVLMSVSRYGSLLLPHITARPKRLLPRQQQFATHKPAPLIECLHETQKTSVVRTERTVTCQEFVDRSVILELEKLQDFWVTPS